MTSMRKCSLAIAWLLFVVASVGCAQPTRGPVEVKGASAQQKPQPVQVVDTPLPNAEDSLKFGILGDFGTGDRGQIEMAAGTEEQVAQADTTTPGDEPENPPAQPDATPEEE